MLKTRKKNIPNLIEYAKAFACSNACKRIDWSVVVMADVAASVLAKLRNKAKASGISYQQLLAAFCAGRNFLRKLSKSGCEDTLILKGDCSFIL